MTYQAEFTYERKDGSRSILKVQSPHPISAATAEYFRMPGRTEQVRRMIVWDLSLPRRSSFEPVRIVDKSFPDCWK